MVPLSNAPMLRWFEANCETTLVQFIQRWLGELGRRAEDVAVVELRQPYIYGVAASQPMPLLCIFLAFTDDTMQRREVYAEDLVVEASTKENR